MTNVQPLDHYLNERYALADRIIDPLTGTVGYAGQTTHMRRKELVVLAALAAANGSVVTRQMLIDTAWDGNDLVGESGVTGVIFALRRSLRESDSDRPLILTIPRKGYQLTVRPVILERAPLAHFKKGQEIPGKSGWNLTRMLAPGRYSQAWLAQGPERVQHVFRFCLQEEHLRALQREVTLLRYLQETLADRSDIATIIDWRLDEPPYFVELDYSSPGSVAEWSAAKGGLQRIPLRQRLSWMIQAAVALSAIHSAGIVHRQLGAAAILLHGDEDEPRVKLGEFGLGELSDRSRLEVLEITTAGLTLSGEEPAGLPCYRAPELLTGVPTTAASDVYALGVLLYQIVASDLQSPVPSDWKKHIESPALRTALVACLDPQPENRPSAQALAARLGAALAAMETKSVARETDAIPVAPLKEVFEQNPWVRKNANGIPTQQIPATPRGTGNAEPTIPNMIGPYRILEPLGDGGMGVVYLAEQRAPVYRRVAIKVIKTGMDSTQILARFEAERQALALMNHVNVAAVFDANTTHLGQPYFAMEYVPGLEIAAHCDKYELDLNERVNLFLQVCDGVLHAHQKGLIHRDLKPSNILVKRAQDQPSTVKIIDFGVTKSLHGKLGEHTTHTRSGSFVGTPAYSSPEQVMGYPVGVDTRSDIYSLGVVLYELLVGVTPFDKAVLESKSPLELSKLLNSQEPPQLLNRFVSMQADVEAGIANSRKSTVAQLKDVLKSDLAWIVSKCLERDPNDRYASVLELEKDLRRWLENRPIEAKPATRGYRLRKLLKRHRRAVIAAVGVSALLLTTTIVAVAGFWQAATALEEAKAARIESDLVAEFQAKQLERIDPSVLAAALRSAIAQDVRQRTMSAGTTHDQFDNLHQGVNWTTHLSAQLHEHFFAPASKTVAEDFSDYPEIQARLWSSLAQSMNSMGLPKEALATQEQALLKYSKFLGDNHQLTLRAIQGRSFMYLESGDLDAAYRDSARALSGLRDLLGENDPAVLFAMTNHAVVLYRQSKLAEAQTLLETAMTRQRKILGDRHRDTLSSMLNLGNLLANSDDKARIDRAHAYLSEAELGFRSTLGEFDVNTLKAANNLAIYYARSGELTKAEDKFSDVVDSYLKSKGELHPQTLSAQVNLATAYLNRSMPNKALTLLSSAVTKLKAIVGPDNPRTLAAERSLGRAYWRTGDLIEAASIMKENMADYRRVFGIDNEQWLISLEYLAQIYDESGKARDAIDSLKSALIELHNRAGSDESISRIEAAITRLEQDHGPL